MQKRIFFLVAMLVFPVAMLAQTSTPPVKMGLWQTTQTSTIAGMGQLPRIVMQSCFTQAEWKNFFKNMQQDHNCTITHMHQTATSMTADMACHSGDSNSTSHVEVSFVSPEEMHGKVHGEITSPKQPQPMVFDSEFDSVYKGADCQGISPHSPRIIR